VVLNKKVEWGEHKSSPCFFCALCYNCDEMKKFEQIINEESQKEHSKQIIIEESEKEYFEQIINEESQKEYFKILQKFIEEEYATKTIFPAKENIYKAFELTPYENVKVVIIGQDPYHGEGEAHGLAFSVLPGIKIPPSLKNIYKELNTELGCYIPNNGYLIKWAQQGVLMINSVLTVEKDKPASHRNKGWEIFTDRIIEEIAKKPEPVVFMLWGNFAKEKENLVKCAGNEKNLIDCYKGKAVFMNCERNKKCDKNEKESIEKREREKEKEKEKENEMSQVGNKLILKSAHPSPFSARHGFFGNNHFVKANEYLKANGLSEIDWQIEDL